MSAAIRFWRPDLAHEGEVHRSVGRAKHEPENLVEFVGFHVSPVHCQFVDVSEHTTLMHPAATLAPLRHTGGELHQKGGCRQ